MNETVSLIICILSFLLALVSVITVIITLKQNAKQIRFNEAQLEEMRKEHQLSLQPVLILENPTFGIERPRPFYSPPEKEFSIQSRYFFVIDVRNATKSVAVFIDAEARLIVERDGKRLQATAVTRRVNTLINEEETKLNFMFVHDKNELLFNALREGNPRLLPKIEVTLYYKNTAGGCFKTSSRFTIGIDEENKEEVKDWHTFLDSVGTRYKEEIDRMKRKGDYKGAIFQSIKDKMTNALGEVRTINLDCFEDIEDFSYGSISQKEYEKAREAFRYPIQLMRAPYCCDEEEQA